MDRRVAVILCNLGGPDSLAAVRPFLFNLFNDPLIVPLPALVRNPLAWLIATMRAKAARANYAKMGGSSPLLAETRKQADALEAVLTNRGVTAKCFVAMRHWRPFTGEAAAAAQAWGATEALLLPLYPQFSASTTASALEEWRRCSTLPTSAVCCWPDATSFVRAHAEAVLQTWREAGSPPHPRVLFSAHGLPARAIAAGDPYQWQVERTCAAVRSLLPHEWETRVCYQSRVGPLEWIGPSTQETIDEALRDRVGVIVSPIAFVSEHVETLVELDIDYRERGAALPFYLRVPALGAGSRFVEALADLAIASLERRCPVASQTGVRICPPEFKLCPMEPT
jgi:ferrochelatase